MISCGNFKISLFTDLFARERDVRTNSNLPYDQKTQKYILNNKDLKTLC